MKLDYYLKRTRTNLEQYCLRLNINSYEELCAHCKKVGITVPREEELNYEFKKDVEKRPVVKSDSKKKGVSDKKANDASRSNSTSTRGSTTKQRVRKSPTKRQRKRKSNNDEPVQPASGSEDTK